MSELKNAPILNDLKSIDVQIAKINDQIAKVKLLILLMELF